MPCVIVPLSLAAKVTDEVENSDLKTEILLSLIVEYFKRITFFSLRVVLLARQPDSVRAIHGRLFG